MKYHHDAEKTESSSNEIASCEFLAIMLDQSWNSNQILLFICFLFIEASLYFSDYHNLLQIFTSLLKIYAEK